MIGLRETTRETMDTQNETPPFIVDMDSHVMEPPDLWLNYLEPEYRDRAIRIEHQADGSEVLMIDDKVLLAGRLTGLGGVEHEVDEAFRNPRLTYMDGCPKASYDTDARIELLDDWGVDAGVVFPTIGILWDKEDNPELAKLPTTFRKQLLNHCFTQVGLMGEELEDHVERAFNVFHKTMIY